MMTRQINKLIRENIKTLSPYTSARDEFKGNNDKMIFIDANENPYVRSYGLNRYPDPNQVELKKKISKLKEVPVKSILLGNGSDEVLDLLFRAFCEPNRDNIIILPPTYGMYEVLANINAIDIIRVDLNTNFEPRVEKILEAKNNFSKLLFICAPNNPTGNNFNSNYVEKLITEFDGIVVIDEAYIDFSNAKSWTTRLVEFPNLVIIQTLSKAYGMAGIRLGIAYASEEIINVLNKIKPPYNINRLTQNEALTQLSSLSKTQQEIHEILEQRNWLSMKLNAISFIEKCYPSDANFILVKVDNANKRYKQFLKNGIVVRNRSTQASCDNCLRLTVGTPEENIKLINVLKNLK